MEHFREHLLRVFQVLSFGFRFGVPANADHPGITGRLVMLQGLPGDSTRASQPSPGETLGPQLVQTDPAWCFRDVDWRPWQMEGAS